MDSHVSFLLLLMYEETLYRIAIKCHQDKLEGDCEEYPLEPENKAQFQALIPLIPDKDIREKGLILEVIKIYGVTIVPDSEAEAETSG